MEGKTCVKKVLFLIVIFVCIMPIAYFSLWHHEEKYAVNPLDAIIDENEEKKRLIKIAIIDSGINDHVELDGKVVKSFNVINDSSKTFDGYNHGTPIAGIIAGNNVGVNPYVALYDVQFLDEDGNGDLEHLVKGIEWAIDEGVDIVNLSFGFQKSNAILEEVITRANRENILVIAAAGNTFGFGVDYPAKLPNVISIGSVDENLSKAYFSGEGKIDFVTVGSNLKSITNKGDVAYFDGTSFSAAYFTGVVTLLISELSNKEEAYKFINNQLKNFAHDLGDKGFDNKYGNGLILLTE